MCLCAGNLELKYLFGLVRTVVNFEILDADLFHFYCTAWESKKWDYPSICTLADDPFQSNLVNLL